MPTVTITLTARVKIDDLEMYEHVKESKECKKLQDAVCDCWEETATAKQISECMASQQYLDEDNIDFDFDSCKSDAKDLPLEPLE